MRVIELPFTRMSAFASQDQADGDTGIEGKGQLIQMVRGLGPWAGCGEIELGLAWDAVVYQTINRTLIAAFSAPTSPRLPERSLFAVEVGRHGIALVLRAVSPVDTEAGVEAFSGSPVCRALALMIERTCGSVPRPVCYAEADYQELNWDAAAITAPGGLTSLTELLKAHGVALSAVKAITAAGEGYGVNQENPNNPDETSPRWRADRFAELPERFLSPKD